MTLMNYPQSKLRNFGVPLQRFDGVGRLLKCTFVLQIVLLINQGLRGVKEKKKIWRLIIIPFKHSPPLGKKLQKITWI